MKNLIITSLIVLFALCNVQGQKKSDIVQAGIEVQRSFEIDYAGGITTPYLEKEEFFNMKGELIEVKEYSNKGEVVKSWFKYKYDTEGNIIEELELDSKGAQKEKFTYKYDKGFKTEKLTYDAKNRLTKKKTYEYGFRK